MADNNVVIKVQADAAAAKSEIQGLGRLLESLGKNGASSGIESVNAAVSKIAKNFDAAEIAVAGLVDKFVDQAGAATSMAKGLSSAATAIKRIETAQREASRSLTAYSAMMRSVAKDQEAFGDIGARSSREIKAEMDKLNAALARLKKSGTATSQDLVRATTAVKKRMSELNAEMVGTGKQMDTVGSKADTLKGNFQKLVGLWVAFQGAMAAGGLIAAIEEMDRLDARLKISEGSAKSAAIAMEEIKRIATETRAPVKEVADAYIRFSTAIQAAGGSQQDAIAFTENLTKALKVSGASAQQVGSTMLQLGQAFQSGVLQGDEFRSVAENGGMVLNYLAKSLGVTRGQLRKMSQEGQLTSDVMLKMSDAAEEINRDFEKIPRTAGDAFVLVSNAFLDVASNSTALKLIIQGLGEVLLFAARNLGELISTAIVAGLSALIISAGGITAAFTAAAAAVSALRIALLSLMTSNPWLLAFAAASMAIIWLWDDIKKAILFVMDLLGMKPKTVVVDDMADQLSALEKQLDGMQAKLSGAIEAVTSQIDKQRKAATDSVKAITSAYQTMAGQIDANATDQINAIKARYAEEKRLIAETKGDSDARYAAESQALITATQQQIEILKDAARQKTELIDQEYTIAAMATRVMFDNERERANALQTLDNEVMQKKRDVLAQMLSDYRSHIDALNAEADRNFQAVKAIEEQKRGLTSSTQDRIRSLQQSAMGEYEAYQDKLKQIDELNAKARAAILEGQSEQAVEYAKKAQEVASGIASGVKENGKEIVSQANATATAIGKITESESIAQAALDARKTAHQQVAQAAQQEAQAVETSMSGIATQLQTVNAQLKDGLQFTVQTNVEQVLADVQALEGFITQREMLLTVQSNLDVLQDQVADMKLELEEDTFSRHGIEDNAKEVQKAIDKLKLPTSSVHTIFEKRVPMPEGKKDGGYIPGYFRGGKLPGFSRTDNLLGSLRGRLIGLAGGEYITNPFATRTISSTMPGLLENLNRVTSAFDLRRVLARFSAPRIGFAGGGHTIAPSMSGSSESLTVTFRAGDIEAPVRITDRNSRESMKAFARELSKIQLVTG